MFGNITDVKPTYAFQSYMFIVCPTFCLSNILLIVDWFAIKKVNYTYHGMSLKGKKERGRRYLFEYIRKYMLYHASIYKTRGWEIMRDTAFLWQLVIYSCCRYKLSSRVHGSVSHMPRIVSLKNVKPKLQAYLSAWSVFNVTILILVGTYKRLCGEKKTWTMCFNIIVLRIWRLISASFNIGEL